jgi:hypothetical protein
MRLTLRNILAYMDDILEPEDAEEIGKKIQESEFATALVHRVRDVMRRLRLGTPDVLGRGLGLDPNTVAEYLDHCLADDPVLDFEKICLESGPESDVHLAEVASCHQILALVLGEPAEVDPASRERMYQLPELAESQAEPAGEGGDLPAARPASQARPDIVDSPTLPPRTGPSVPEWLREERSGRRGWWPTVAAVSLALLFGVFLLAVTGQLNPGSFLGDLLGLEPADRSMVQGPEPAPVGTSQEPPSEVDGKPAAEPRQAASPDAETAGAGLPATDDRTTTPSAEAGEGPRPGMEAPSSAGPSEPAMPREELPATAIPGTGAPSAPQAFPPTVQDPGMPDEPGTEAAGPTSTLPAPLAQPSIPEVSAVASDQEAVAAEGPGVEPDQTPQPEPATTAAPLPPQVVGQFDSPGQVLLVFDAEARAWDRLRDKAPLMSQTRYLSLPTYRPMVRLADQTRVWLVDGSEIDLLPADQEGVQGLVLNYGGLVLESPDNAPSRLRLQVGDQSGAITFDEAGSRLGIEVVRDASWNADPETQPAPLTVGLYAASGRILWQGETDREPLSLDAPFGVTLKDKPFEEVPAEQFPSWVVADTIKKLDQMASEVVEREWELDKPAMLRLRELTIHRRREYRSLALECLDYLGDFELAVAALDNPEEKSAWVDYFEQLRAAVLRSPQTAAQVRATMEKLHGSEGAGLYEMLWKYNDDVLDNDDAARLVRYLDHNTLAFRVVSFETLKRITRLSFGYRPEDTAARRQPAIKKWKEWKDRLPSKPRVPPGAPAGTAAPAEAPSSEEPLSDFPDGFGL